MHYQLQASTLNGNVRVPPSKSHTLRAILFASLACGESMIRDYLVSPDTDAMISACRALGAQITRTTHTLHVVGVNGQPQTPADVIQAGNSGQVLRFVGALAALTSGYCVLTGDDSIRHNRPIQPLIDGLQGLGVFAATTRDNGYAPIIVRGPILGAQTTLTGADSQPVSGLLIAAAFAHHSIEINVTEPGELPWIDLTLDWFNRLGIKYQRQGHTYYKIMGNSTYPGFDYTVPGDFSAAAFLMVAALITRSQITLHNLDMQDCQGDKQLLFALEKMGAQFVVDAEQKTITVTKTEQFSGQSIDVNHFIDAVPILAVMACFAQSETVIQGALIARHKESDRLQAITTELTKMGADITELPDGLVIKPAALNAACVYSYADHRIAMALAVAGLAATGEMQVNQTQCVAKSYPGFAESLQSLGANMQVVV